MSVRLTVRPNERWDGMLGMQIPEIPILRKLVS